MEQRPCRVSGGHVRRVNLEAPRQSRWSTEELLVEPVSPTADRLGDQQSRSQGVGDGAEAYTRTFDGDIHAERAEGDATPDTQASTPDLEGEHRVTARAEISIRGRDDVVDARTDDAERDRPERGIVQRVWVSTAVAVTAGRPPDADDHTCGDDDAVGPQRNRPKVPDTLRGRRDTGRDEGAHARAPLTPDFSSVASSPRAFRPRSTFSSNRVFTSADPTMTPSA